MRRFSVISLALFFSSLSFANTAFFAIVAQDPGVKQLEREQSDQNFILQSFERSRIQVRCLGCMNVDVVFQNYETRQTARYQASVDCENKPCKVYVNRSNQ